MPLSSGEHVKAAIEDRIALVTIDHQPVNALNRKTLQELARVVEEIRNDASIKTVILTGAGSLAFVAGADIKEVSQLESMESAKEMASLGQGVFLSIQQPGKPVIAAINGVCLGGGCELALSCHLRISGDRARFGQPEISLGIIPGWGGTQRLPRLIGRAKATEWILTGDIVSAQEALRLGLVNQVVPQDQVMKASKDLARKLASKGAIALSQALRAIDEGLDLPLAQGLAQEASAFSIVANTADSKEGVRAFIEKRQPKFADR
jgi:enoyl-CoA hydratase/carnithine racemase